MTKPYKILECSNYKNINDGLLDYVNKYTNLLTNDPTKSDYDPLKTPIQYPNFPEKFGYSISHFIQNNPLLIEWCRSFNLILRDAYFTLAWSSSCQRYPESSCPIHLDKPPVFWKLNWPILNMEHTAIRFYKLKDPSIDINSLVQRQGDPNSKDNDEYLLEYKDFEEIDRYRFDERKPIMLNGMVPHDVGFYENPQFPRIGFQGMFFKEPTHLL